MPELLCRVIVNILKAAYVNPGGRAKGVINALESLVVKEEFAIIHGNVTASLGGLENSVILRETSVYE